MRNAVALPLVVPLLALAACSSSPSEMTSTPESAVNEGAYLTAVREVYPSTTSDAILIDLGYGVCDLLDQADDPVAQWQNLVVSTDPDSEAAFPTYAAATAFLCPEYLDILDS